MLVWRLKNSLKFYPKFRSSESISLVTIRNIGLCRYTYRYQSGSLFEYENISSIFVLCFFELYDLVTKLCKNGDANWQWFSSSDKISAP